MNYRVVISICLPMQNGLWSSLWNQHKRVTCSHLKCLQIVYMLLNIYILVHRYIGGHMCPKMMMMHSLAYVLLSYKCCLHDSFNEIWSCVSCPGSRLNESSQIQNKDPDEYLFANHLARALVMSFSRNCDKTIRACCYWSSLNSARTVAYIHLQ
jgi:hypothetical protein